MLETAITLTVKSIVIKLISLIATLETVNIIYFNHKLKMQEKQIKALKIAKHKD